MPFWRSRRAKWAIPVAPPRGIDAELDRLWDEARCSTSQVEWRERLVPLSARMSELARAGFDVPPEPQFLVGHASNEPYADVRKLERFSLRSIRIGRRPR